MAIDDFLGLRSFSDEDLTPEFRRSLIRDYLSTDESQELSGASILSAFRNLGLGISTGDFYELLRDVRGIVTDARRIRQLGYDTVPKHEQFALNPNRQKDEYRYVLKITWQDSDTGELIVDYRFADSSYRLSKRDIENSYMDYLEAAYPTKFDNLTSFEFDRGYRRS